ncbi:MAG TPA: hypothetical protein VFX97_16825 [Pyrinomonadaceae bacterium]|nr:hypothetical protein [Pyrinomonadaceae bacterium]
MADVVLVTAGQLRVEESLEQDTKPAGVAIAAGQSVRQDATTGKWALADASVAGTADAYGMAVKTVPAGLPVTAIRRGVIEGFDLTDQDYGEQIFLSDTAGAIADAAGTVSKVVGDVTSVHTHLMGGTPDKLLRVNYSGEVSV